MDPAGLTVWMDPRNIDPTNTEKRVGSFPDVSTKRVLFATDFSDCAAVALPYALNLAAQPGGKLIAAHVVSMGPVPTGFPAREWLATAAQGVREARDSMERIESQLQGLKHEIVVRSGDVCGQIAAIVRSEPVDVIVLGTHGRTGLRKAVFGSVAEKLFRHAARPVLTIGPHVNTQVEGMQEIHSILCPTDFSQEAEAALGYAVSLARERGARLYLLHIPKPGRAWDRAFLEQYLLGLLPAEPGLQCEPKAMVEEGEAAEVIVDEAREIAADLIVMGPKRRSGMPGTMATTYRVVTEAPCPVLTVRG
jgi:nucleotide-binding universal stress UspA family protein